MPGGEGCGAAGMWGLLCGVKGVAAEFDRALWRRSVCGCQAAHAWLAAFAVNCTTILITNRLVINLTGALPRACQRGRFVGTTSADHPRRF